MVNIIKRVVPHIKGISCNAKLKTNTGYALHVSFLIVVTGT